MIALAPAEVAARIEAAVPGAIEEVMSNAVVIRPEKLLEAMTFLRDEPSLRFDYLSCISGVDYIEYFEMVYQLYSIPNNYELVVKARAFGRERPTVPSVISVWRGADFQEREIYDLLGVYFSGHPDLRRIMMWDGFEGHPLRKDYFYENFPRRFGA